MIYSTKSCLLSDKNSHWFIRKIHSDLQFGKPSFTTSWGRFANFENFARRKVEGVLQLWKLSIDLNWDRLDVAIIKTNWHFDDRKGFLSLMCGQIEQQFDKKKNGGLNLRKEARLKLIGLRRGYIHIMDRLHYGQNFEKSWSGKVYYHSIEEHPKISKIAKFGCEML